MSTKDNWDDESSDEEGDTPPSPLPKGEISPLEKDIIQEEYYEAQFVDDDGVPPEDQNDEECSPEGGAWGDAPQEDDSDEGAWGDPPDDYEDELDNYDKKLGRYVAFR